MPTKARPAHPKRPPANEVPTRPLHMAAGIVAVLFFAIWLAFLIGGADWPPPVGFLIVVGVLAALTVLVYYRGQTYIAWRHARRPGRVWRVVLDGFAAGLVVAVLIWIASAVTSPGLPQPTLLDRAVWLLVLGTAGLVSALAVYGGDVGVFSLLTRKKD